MLKMISIGVILKEKTPLYGIFNLLKKLTLDMRFVKSLITLLINKKSIKGEIVNKYLLSLLLMCHSHLLISAQESEKKMK